MEDNSDASNVTLSREELEVARMKAEALAERNRIRLYETETKILATNLDLLSGPAREVMKMK
jgi:hypothetical protein